MKLPFTITDDISIDQISAYIDQIKEHDREYQEELRNEIKAIEKERRINMDTKDLADAKRRLGVAIYQDIRGFEQKTGMEVVGIKINRQDNAETYSPIESVTVKVELPD